MAFTDDLAYWHIIAEVEKDEPILKNSDDYNIWFTQHSSFLILNFPFPSLYPYCLYGNIDFMPRRVYNIFTSKAPAKPESNRIKEKIL